MQRGDICQDWPFLLAKIMIFFLSAMSADLILSLIGQTAETFSADRVF